MQIFNQVLLLLLLGFLDCIWSSRSQPKTEYIVDPVRLTEAPYALWAHFPWVWLHRDDESQESSIQLVNDYIYYDIPIGAILIDSAWPRSYQDFVWDPVKFPNATQMVSYFHSIDIKVVCWITSIIRNDSTTFDEAKKNGYLLNDGKLIKYDHGIGAFFDYTNPKALDWWHRVNKSRIFKDKQNYN